MLDFKVKMLKCTKFDFGWGYAPTPMGEITALPRPLAEFKGPTSKGRERIGGEGKKRIGRREKKRTDH